MGKREEKTAKAKIAKATKKGKPVKKTAFEVQFNPASLKIATRTNVEGGRSSGRPSRSQNGINTATLSVELVFDTSDDGTTDEPIDVQTLTAKFRRFVEPQAKNSKKPPDPIWFHWGKFTFTGIVESLDEELEFFSFYGVALRAKLTLNIKKQDFKFEANKIGQGARDQDKALGRQANGAARNNQNGKDKQGGKDAPAPGAPGTSGDGDSDNAAEALAGESAADFAERNGLPASKWRAVTNPSIEDPLSLPAGLEVPFPNSINVRGQVNARVAATVGVDLTAPAAVALAVGIDGGGAAGSSGPDAHKVGVAGGLDAALETLAEVAASDRAATERAARPSPATSNSEGGPSARGSSDARAGRVPAPRVAADLPVADRRATSYGRGVPLRDATRSIVTRRPRIGATTSAIGPAGRGSAADPPWTFLSDNSPGHLRSDLVQNDRRSTLGCGCCTPPGPRRCRCGCHARGGA